MESGNKIENAGRIFLKLCGVLDARNWTYEKKEEELTIHFGVQGEDLPMPIRLRVHAERQFVQLMSVLPFDVPEDKRLDVALAVSAVNCNLADGNFDYDVESGTLGFRLTHSYIECDISEASLDGMIDTACTTIDNNNDKLKGIIDGTLSLGQFLAGTE